jgi:hypothetical protein
MHACVLFVETLSIVELWDSGVKCKQQQALLCLAFTGYDRSHRLRTVLAEPAVMFLPEPKWQNVPC